MIDKLTTFIVALIKHAQDNFTKVSPQQKMERIITCFKCENRNPQDWTCNLCGCSIELKSDWKSERCPAEKWSLDVISNNPLVKSDCGCN